MAPSTRSRLRSQPRSVSPRMSLQNLNRFARVYTNQLRELQRHQSRSEQESDISENVDADEEAGSAPHSATTTSTALAARSSQPHSARTARAWSRPDSPVVLIPYMPPPSALLPSPARAESSVLSSSPHGCSSKAASALSTPPHELAQAASSPSVYQLRKRQVSDRQRLAEQLMSDSESDTEDSGSEWNPISSRPTSPYDEEGALIEANEEEELAGPADCDQTSYRPPRTRPPQPDAAAIIAARTVEEATQQPVAAEAAVYSQSSSQSSSPTSSPLRRSNPDSIRDAYRRLAAREDLLCLRLCEKRTTDDSNLLGCVVARTSATCAYPKVDLRESPDQHGKVYGHEFRLTTLMLIAQGRVHEALETVEGKKHVSHLCHNRQCIHPDHLVVELQSHNEARNRCRGHTDETTCDHGPQRCLLPHKTQCVDLDMKPNSEGTLKAIRRDHRAIPLFKSIVEADARAALIKAGAEADAAKVKRPRGRPPKSGVAQGVESQMHMDVTVVA